MDPISPKDLVASNYSHLEMVYEIRNWIMRCSPCMLMGHNSIKFDENFLRHAFYRTLHPLYLTNTNGNNRADTMRIAQAAAIFAPGSINIPQSEKGKPVFKLGEIVRANGINFNEEDAHDALADVRATLELARLLRNKVPAIWEQMLNNSTKKTALAFMRSNPAFCVAEVNYGNPATYLVTAIASNPTYDAEMAVFDLSYNPDDYLGCSVDELLAVMIGKEKAIRIVPANNQPIMVNTTIGNTLLEQAPVDQETLYRRVQQIQSATEFKQRVAVALTMRYKDKETSQHIEEMIYTGFPSRSDEALMGQFHKIPPEERALLCRKFGEIRYAEVASRLMYAENPDHLEQTERSRMDKHFQERLLKQEKVPWLTIPKALQDIDELKKEEGKMHPLLAEIEAFIQDMHKRFSAT